MSLDSLPPLTLHPQRARPFWSGHAVVRASSVADGLTHPAGSLVRLVDDRGATIGPAIMEGGMETAAWLLGRSTHGLVARVNRGAEGIDWDALLDELLARSQARRAGLHRPRTLVAGAADDLPGLRVRRFDDAVLAAIGSAALARHAPALDVRLRERLGTAEVRVVVGEDDGNTCGDRASGAVRPQVMEAGVPVSTRRWAHHAQSWARREPMRARVATVAAGRAVLDLTATGDAAAAAVAGGAANVVWAACERRRVVRANALVGRCIDLEPEAAAQALWDQRLRFDVVVGEVPVASPSVRSGKKRDLRVWNLMRLVRPSGGRLLVWSDDEGDGDARLVHAAAVAAGRMGVSVRVRAIDRARPDEATLAAASDARRWTLIELDVEGDVEGLDAAGDVEEQRGE